MLFTMLCVDVVWRRREGSIGGGELFSSFFSRCEFGSGCVLL